MESKECFDYLYSLSPKRLVINREISPPQTAKNDWSLEVESRSIRIQKLKGQDATFLADKACLIRQLLD